MLCQFLIIEGFIILYGTTGRMIHKVFKKIRFENGRRTWEVNGR